MARKRVAQSPDGRSWTIDVSRYRGPRWRESDYAPEEEYLPLAVLEHLYALVVWFVVPFLLAVVELPVAVARSLFGSRRWIEARSNDVTPITALFAADRADADRVAGELAELLRTGYGWTTPAGAEFVELTEPPGLRDLDA